MIEFEHETDLRARIKVVGVGGGGGNAINTMIRAGLSGVEFIATNTDAQALAMNLAPTKIHLGDRGLGAGADPRVGRTAADSSRERLAEVLAGADMVFVTAGLGGGTGTGGAPIVAEVAKELGALTVAVVTKPFVFEGAVRKRQSEQGIDSLHDVVDTLITIPNERLLLMAGEDISMMDAFRIADDVLLNAVQGISDLITVHGIINLDFADVRTIMSEMGMALMGTGRARGENRAIRAAQEAISNPLLDDVSIKGARGVLVNITGGPDMKLKEANEAVSLIHEEAHEEANIIFGSVVQENLGDEIRVTVIATGLSDASRSRRKVAITESFENVTPLRLPLREAPTVESLTEASMHAPRGQAAFEANGTNDFVSPFEEEYDVPAFIRRTRDTD